MSPHDRTSPHHHKTLGVGVIGMGFMGRTHVAAYQSARAAGYPVKLVAVADTSEEKLRAATAPTGNIDTGSSAPIFDPNSVKLFTDINALVDDPEIDIVSVCTPTDTHSEVAHKALYAGKHVLVEKPVAIEAEDVKHMADVAYRMRRVCMPAFCMRHWPGWPWLRDCIRDQRFGRLRGLTLQRLGTRPNWSPHFYANNDRCGGALLDLHIHDVDFIIWCFGHPTAVITSGDLDHVTTIYRVQNSERDPVRVVAQGGWDHAPGFPFTMRYSAVFEAATATFDLSRDPAVLLHIEGRSDRVELPTANAYEAQARHFIDTVIAHDAGRSIEHRATLDDAVVAAELLDAERDSMMHQREVHFGR